jgi:glutathione S-transferase
MIRVHHLNNSRSQRVLWMLEELELPYELVKYERTAAGLAPESLLKVHPLGKSPVIDDDGVIVAESGAILEYLVDKAGGKLAPAPGSAAHRDYRYWLHYAEGSLMPLLLLRFLFGQIKGKAPWLVRPIARKIADSVDGQFIGPNLARHVAFLAGELGSAPWFCGDELTAADIQMIYPMEAIASRTSNPPKAIGEWVAAMKARPAYARALDKGGPYEIMS